MKQSALLLTTLLVLQFIAPLSSLANPISFTPSSNNGSATLQGQLPINKVGALLAADCLAILNGNEITIQQNRNHNPKLKKSKTPDPTKEDLLKGEMIKSKIETTGDKKTISGIAYFNGGSQFERLTRVNCDDRVTLTDGQELSGVIQSVDKMQLSLKTASAVQLIKITDVAAIHSARAFNFSMPLPANTDAKNPSGFSAELSRLTLIPTCHVIAAGITRSSKIKRVLIVASTLTIVATAIAVPIAVSVATHHHHSTPFRPILQQPAPTTITTVQPITKVVVGPVVKPIGLKTLTEFNLSRVRSTVSARSVTVNNHSTYTSPTFFSPI